MPGGMAELRLYGLRKRRVETHLLVRNHGSGWRIDELHDALEHIGYGDLVRIQSGLQFGFECRQLPRQFAGVGEQAAHLDEGADDEDAHLHGLRAIQDGGCHEGAMLGEGEGLGA